MKALVTGGAGLVGSHLVDLLVEKGIDVNIIDNLETETHLNGIPNWINKKSNFVYGDIRNKEILASAIEDADWIFHEAAYGGFTPEFEKYVDVNDVGTAKIFGVIREKGLKIKKVIIASSQAVYGEGTYKCKNHGVIFPPLRAFTQMQRGGWEINCPKCNEKLESLPTGESKCVDPASMYSVTKYAEEKIGLLLGLQLGIPTVALRYSVTYGPRQSLYNPYTGICSIFSTRLLNGLPPFIYEDGQQTRDFVYVGDVARANLFVAEHDEVNFKVFNVSYNQPIRILDFARILAESYNKDIGPVLDNEFRIGDVRHLYLDNDLLAHYGFRPHTDLRTGIKKYADWILSHGDVKEYFSVARKGMLASGIVRKALNG